MLEGLGARVREVTAPFDPEGGAYGGAHQAHDHGHDDHHHRMTTATAMFMTTDPPRADVSGILFAWFSPAFPTGGFAYSHGIETAATEGRIGGETELLAWLADVLNQGAGWTDAVLFALAHRAARAGDAARLPDLAALGAAFAPSRERLAETLGQGAAFLAAVREGWPDAAAELADQPAYPVAAGACCGRIGASLPIALRPSSRLLRQPDRGGVRLASVARRAACASCRRSAPTSLDLARRASEAEEDDLGGCAFGSDIASHAARDPGREAVPVMTYPAPIPTSNGPLRVGVGGPVGSGKTTLVEKLCKAMRGRWSVAVITNDIYTREDALILSRLQALPEDRILGVETGGCPHTAIREDASINLAAVRQMSERFPDLDVIFIESGGDNLAATFSPDLADLTLYVVSVCQGEKIPRKGGPAISRSDLLIVNKTDLAPYVGADIEVMRRDAAVQRGERPTVFTDLLRLKGVEEVVRFIAERGALPQAATEGASA